MKTFTIDDIRSWKPCYDPKRYLSEGWRGTAIDILKHDTIPHDDKLWVVCRESVIDKKTLRLFAVWCARQVEHLMTDERSKDALNLAERFAHGEATDEELSAARSSSFAAASSAAFAAVTASASYAAYASVRNKQIAKLIEMLEGEGE